MGLFCVFALVCLLAINAVRVSACFISGARGVINKTYFIKGIESAHGVSTLRTFPCRWP